MVNFVIVLPQMFRPFLGVAAGGAVVWCVGRSVVPSLLPIAMKSEKKGEEVSCSRHRGSRAEREVSDQIWKERPLTVHDGTTRAAHNQLKQVFGLVD